MKIAKKFGMWVRAQRKKKKMSQGELAQKLKASQSFVSKMEAGTLVPNLLQIARLGDIFSENVFHGSLFR